MDQIVSNERDIVVTEFGALRAVSPADQESQIGDHEIAHDDFSITEVLTLIWVERRFISNYMLLVSLTFAIIAFLLPKHYTATTRLMPPGYGANSGMALALPALIDHAGSTGNGVMGLASQLLGTGTPDELMVGVIQSWTVEDRVVETLGLMNVYSDKYAEDARKHLERNTSISIGARTGIISISVTDKKPDRAAAIAKAYVAELNEVLAEVNATSAHRERVFLEERLQQVTQQSDADAKEFALFASENAAIDIPSQAKAMVAAGAELQSQLIAAESELKGLQQIYTANNARVRSLQARVDELRRQVDKFGGKDVDPAKDASLAHSELYPSARQLPLLGVKYLDLYRRTKIDDAVFELLTKEYEVAKVQEARDVPTAKVLDIATVPEKKSSPHRLLIILVGAFVGFVSAGTYLFGRLVWERTDYNSPMKRLVQEIFSTIADWTDRTPPFRAMKMTVRRILIWLPHPVNGQ